jgi:hypothetical protein
MGEILRGGGGGGGEVSYGMVQFGDGWYLAWWAALPAGLMLATGGL